jgi:C-8 sterol isomerase
MGFIFDPDVLHDIIKGTLGQPIEDTIEQLAHDLAERYPGHVLPNTGWVFNNAGGAMGSMRVLHASLTEYILVFGSAIGTEGASGRFHADDYFYMLEGEHWCYGEGEFERTVTSPGEVSVLKRGESKAYRFPDRAWGVEYARGTIPLMLPFGLADTFTSTLDFKQLSTIIRMYGKHVVHNLMQGKI